MQTLTAAELAAWLRAPDRPAPLLLDVREPWEFEYCAIPASQLIPMGEISAHLGELPRDRPIVCICHHGMRSLQVAHFLEHQGFAAVHNLTGGIHAWSSEVDPSVPTY